VPGFLTPNANMSFFTSAIFAAKSDGGRRQGITWVPSVPPQYNKFTLAHFGSGIEDSAAFVSDAIF
jgi:hypothetical protein